jgi:hypothetical protein
VYRRPGRHCRTKWYRFLWATAWKRPKKICKWTNASGVSAHSVAIARSIPKQHRDSGRKNIHYPVCFSYTSSQRKPITISKAPGSATITRSILFTCYSETIILARIMPLFYRQVHDLPQCRPYFLGSGSSSLVFMNFAIRSIDTWLSGKTEKMANTWGISSHISR